MNSGGTVFELPKAADGYSPLKTLVRFSSSADGLGNPAASLIADANGDLFGTAYDGGVTNGFGGVFEIAKTPDGYASAPTTLATFDFNDGSNPTAGLITDDVGNLFGTTSGGAASFGNVFEIASTSNGYLPTPIPVVTFNLDDGADPEGGLIADAKGDLFGTGSAQAQGNSGENSILQKRISDSVRA